MLEIVTRRFRLEDGEELHEMCEFVKTFPGYIPQSLAYVSSKTIKAEFSKKVI